MIKTLYQKLLSERTRYRIHIILRKLKALFLQGESYHCPCCEKSFSRFLPKGNGLETRLNAVCPGCGSLERSRLLYLYLKNETRIFQDQPAILHFAPEDALKKFFKDHLNYIDADINPNLATHRVDITEIPFPDAYFDFIICSHVLGHIPDEQKAVSELYRVLRNGGTLFLLSLMDPQAAKTKEDETLKTPEQKLRAYGEKDLMRLYGNDLAERLQSPDVQIEIIDYRTRFSAEERQRFSLGDGKRELIYKITRV